MLKKVLGLCLVLVMLVATMGGCTVIGLVPTIVTFEVVPQNIFSGQPATLIWSVTGADRVNIQPDVGQVALSGSRQVSPSNTIAYTLTASSNTATVTKSVVLNVSPQVEILNFSANPVSINEGESTILNWSVNGATSIIITPDIGTVASSGSRSISPSTSTTYTLIAQAGSQQKSSTLLVTVNRAPIITSFSASPANISFGGTSMLSWNVTGATRVRIEPNVGNVPSSGTRNVSPTSSTTYILIAESECCVVDKTAAVQVSAATPPPFIPSIVIFNISPNSIYAGGTATLQWHVLGAESVQINQGIGVVPSSGSVQISPSHNTIYTLTAYNAYGYRIASVGIVVFEI